MNEYRFFCVNNPKTDAEIREDVGQIGWKYTGRVFRALRFYGYNGKTGVSILEEGYKIYDAAPNSRERMLNERLRERLGYSKPETAAAGSLCQACKQKN